MSELSYKCIPKSTSDMPDFAASDDGIGLLTEMYARLKQISQKCAQKSKEADVCKNRYIGDFVKF